MTFDDLIFGPRGHQTGVQALEFFANGYGASVIQGPYTYGGDKGLYELAVVRGSLEDFSLDYSTPITSDVCGYLTKDDVTRLLGEVEALPDPAQ